LELYNNPPKMGITITRLWISLTGICKDKTKLEALEDIAEEILEDIPKIIANPSAPNIIQTCGEIAEEVIKEWPILTKED